MKRGQATWLIVALGLVVVFAAFLLYSGGPVAGRATAGGGGASIEVLHADGLGNVIGGSSFPANSYVVVRGSLPPGTSYYQLLRNGASWISGVASSPSMTESRPFNYKGIKGGAVYGANNVELRACIFPSVGKPCVWQSGVAQTSFEVVPLGSGSVEVVHATSTGDVIGGSVIPLRTYVGTLSAPSYVVIRGQVPIGTFSYYVKRNGATWYGGYPLYPAVSSSAPFKLYGMQVPPPVGVQSVELFASDGTKWWSVGNSQFTVYDPAKCGNKALEPGEQCDDGNKVDGDGCSSTCRKESLCGNYVIEEGEECDDGKDGDVYCTETCVVRGCIEVTE